MISIIVPALNEEESLPPFYDELMKVVPTLDTPYEIIFIDDGSTDKTLAIMKELAQKNKHIRISSFRKNLGKSEALTFAFQKAKGEYIVTLDADLQDKPSEMPKFLAKAKEGVEVVCGWKKDRKDKPHMVVISRMFNKLLGAVFGLRLHDYNCGYKLYTRDAAKSLRLYGGLYRFIPLLLYQQGFTVEEIPVEHQARKFGQSKYGFSKLWKDLPDLFTMLFLSKYSKRPLHFFGIIGGILGVIGMLILSYLTVLHFMGYTIGRRPLIFLGMLLIIAGFQIFFTGFLADLMISISQQRDLPHYSIKYESEDRS